MTIEQNLNISLYGFNSEEDANTIGYITRDVIKNLDEHFSLELMKLKSIVVSCDFATALQKVTSDYGHKSPSSYTKSSQGEAVGQMVSKMNSDGSHEEFTLVLSSLFFIELFNDEGKIEVAPEGIRPVIHRLHHELVHVHEFNTITTLDNNFSLNDYGFAVLLAAKKAWSEYLANYLSAPTATKDSLDAFLEHFNNVIKEVPAEIYNFKEKYRIGMMQLDEMFHEVIKRVKLISDACGYAMGYVHALDIDVDDYFPDLSKSLDDKQLTDCFMTLSQTFSDLRIKYENNDFKNLDEYAQVAKSIDNIYKKFGLTLECDSWGGESSLYIHVK